MMAGDVYEDNIMILVKNGKVTLVIYCCQTLLLVMFVAVCDWKPFGG